MDAAEALRIVLSEGGGGPDPIYMCLRNRDDPGSERMRRRIDAVRITVASESGKSALDRAFASALWGVGHIAWEQYALWPEAARAVRPSLEKELIDLSEAVEAVFFDDRTDPLV